MNSSHENQHLICEKKVISVRNFRTFAVIANVDIASQIATMLTPASFTMRLSPIDNNIGKRSTFGNNVSTCVTSFAHHASKRTRIYRIYEPSTLNGVQRFHF